MDPKADGRQVRRLAVRVKSTGHLCSCNTYMQANKLLYVRLVDEAGRQYRIKKLKGDVHYFHVAIESKHIHVARDTSAADKLAAWE